MALIYTRGRALKTAIAVVFAVVAEASLLTVAVHLVMFASGGSQPDLGWGVLAGVSTGLAVWATRSRGLLRLLSVADPWVHQSRKSAVWGLLAQPVILIRFPMSTQYLDRAGEPQSVDWVVAFSGYNTPLAPVFKLERNLQRWIGLKLSKFVATGEYQLIHFHEGAVVLKRVSSQGGTSAEAALDPRSCSWLN